MRLPTGPADAIAIVGARSEPLDASSGGKLISTETRPRSTGRRRRRRSRRPAPAVVVVLVLVLVLGIGGLVVGLVGASSSGAEGPSPAASPAGTDPVAIAAATPPAPGARPFQVGVVGSEDPASIDQLTSLGARVARAEFTPDTTVEQLAPLVGTLAARGIRLQPLVGWEDGTPAPDLTPVARWAAAFGPRGTFWGGRSDATADPGHRARERELEVLQVRRGRPSRSTGHWPPPTAAAPRTRRGPSTPLTPRSASWSSWSPATAARRPGSTTPLAAGGPDLVRLLHAPVIHAYGPDWRRKLDENFRFLARRGVHQPYAMTEWGIASDDGADLDDNYDWPTDLTDDQAAGLLTTAVGEMSALPNELGQVLLFQLHDQREPGTDTDREHYFGLLRLDGSPKTAYTAAARSAYTRYP